MPRSSSTSATSPTETSTPRSPTRSGSTTRAAPQWPPRWPDVCRWLAYSGAPVVLEDLLYRPAHSLIDQSLHSELGAETTNGDGFGVGWYDATDEPGVFRSIEPAWNDANLR